MVIDSDYRGEILVPLYNDSSVDQEIQIGDRIAQLIFQPVCSIIPNENNEVWEIVTELSNTQRNDSGFGSTGDK